MTLMLVQCITSVKIHCITCITLNNCLSEILPSIVYRLHNREIRYTKKGCVSISFYYSQCVRLACKDRYLTKEYVICTVKLASKGMTLYQ